MIDKFNALIVGAGNIGALYDEPASKLVLTHAHAYSIHDKFELKGFVDSNYERAEYAAKKWGRKAYSSIDEALQDNKLDVISLCAPDEYHFDLLKYTSSLPIKYVFAEKPLAMDVKQAMDIVNIYEKSLVKVAINYSRRYVPQFVDLKKKIEMNQFGEYVTGGCYYGKGINHNGSHAIDILRYLVGEVEDTHTISAINDFYEDDPTITGVIYLNKHKSFFMLGVDTRFYSVFEVDLLFSKKRIRIYDSGFRYEVYDVCPSSVFNGFVDLMYKETIKTKLNCSMYFAIDNIYRSLINESDIKCTIKDGYEAIKVCEDLKRGISNANTAIC